MALIGAGRIPCSLPDELVPQFEKERAYVVPIPEVITEPFVFGAQQQQAYQSYQQFSHTAPADLFSIPPVPTLTSFDQLLCTC